MIFSPLGKFWRVELGRHQSGMLLGDGWEQFLTAHDLSEGNILVFRYEDDWWCDRAKRCASTRWASWLRKSSWLQLCAATLWLWDTLITQVLKSLLFHLSRRKGRPGMKILVWKCIARSQIFPQFRRRRLHRRRNLSAPCQVIHSRSGLPAMILLASMWALQSHYLYIVLLPDKHTRQLMRIALNANQSPCSVKFWNLVGFSQFNILKNIKFQILN